MSVKFVKYIGISINLNYRKMFGFIKEVTGGLAKVVGAVVGTVIGVPSQIVAKTLGITENMVREAKNAGCETYEEIKRHFDLD